jgi:acylphosphatase
LAALTHKHMSETSSEPRKGAAETKPIRSVHVLVSGRVQGVFFRSGLKATCDRLGVRGWVKNKPDGDVEALLQGREEELEKAIRWCKRGPEGAEVSRVETHDQHSDAVQGNFEIVY